MNEKESAVENAKNAAVEQPGLVLNLTKEQYGALKEAANSARLNAAEIAFDITKLVNKFFVYKTIVDNVKSIVSTDQKPATKIEGIQAVLESQGNQYSLEEAKAEEKPTLASAATDVTKSVENVGKSALGLAMAIPLLMANPEILNMVKSFFTGFLEGLGLSNNAISMVKIAVSALLGILAVSFTMKALSPVITLFNAVKRLATVLGLAGKAVQAGSEETAQKHDDVKKKDAEVKSEKGKIDKEKGDIKKGTDTAKSEVKSGKDEIKKAKKAGKGSKTAAGKLYDKIKYLFEKVKPKLISMTGNILKALPIAGTILGIGLVLYELYSIGSDVYDVFFGNDDEDAEEGKQTPVASTTAAPGAAAGSAPAPAAAPAAESKPSAAATAAPAASGAASGGGGSAPAAAAAASSPAPAAESKPSAAGTSESAGASSSAAPTPEPAAVAKMVEPTPSTNDKQVISQSETVDQMERDNQKQQGLFVLNVNNNNIINKKSEASPDFSGYSYSTTVGV